MERIVALLCCCVLALGLTACGDGDGIDFEGLYEITRHTLNDAGCDAEGPDVTNSYPYFQLQMGEILGFPVLDLYYCESETKCNEVKDKFFSKQPDGWKIIMRMSSEFEGECTLSDTIGPLQKTEEGVKLQVRTSGATVTPAQGEECNPDLIDAYSDRMVCEEYEVIEARNLSI